MVLFVIGLFEVGVVVEGFDVRFVGWWGIVSCLVVLELLLGCDMVEDGCFEEVFLLERLGVVGLRSDGLLDDGVDGKRVCCCWVCVGVVMLVDRFIISLLCIIRLFVDFLRLCVSIWFMIGIS